MKKIHRFIGAYDLRATEIVLDKDTAHQVTRVLKMRVGERIMLCDGANKEAEFELTDASARRVGEIRELEDVTRAVILYAAILKRESFEWAVQKAVECGVTRIMPIITRRTIKKDVKLERLQEIAKEAAEQCGRGIIPEVSEPVSFKDALEDAKGNDVNMFLDVGATRRVAPTGKHVGLFIGPEGGWDEEEVSLAKKAGVISASLGPRVLRGETAAAIATYLAAAL